MGRKIYRTPIRAKQSSTSSPSTFTLPTTAFDIDIGAMPQTAAAREHALNLMARKDQLERELKEQRSILRQNDDIGLRTPLVDADGFPRSDIDVWAVRHARVRYTRREPIYPAT